jgi:hypothetical protein
MSRASVAALGLCAAFALSEGCGRRASTPGPTLTWYAGRARPTFDPDGPPDALRFALERHLSRGLVERDSTGAVHPALASSIECSADSLTWTFQLPPALRFTDGSKVTSAHMRAALTAGLARADHATRAWLLGAVRGVSQVRPGRALPALGIETPDEHTLVLRLAVRDRRLLEKLAVPGVATPWKRRSGQWADAVGVGPYRVVRGDGERSLTLAGASPVAGAVASLDTLRVRFGSGAGRARTMMREGLADVTWPVTPGLLDQPLPRGWSVERRMADPPRRLLLILRADVPPTTRSAVRQTLAGALNREELLGALGARGEPLRRWLPGSRRDFDWPRLETAAERAERRATEAATVPRRSAEPRRPESHHLTAAFDADLAGALVLPALQRQWEQAGHYVDVRALRGAAAGAQALRAAAAQVHLVESQALLPGLEPELAQLVMPLRGPAVGAYRTGWRTRELDRHLLSLGTSPGPDPDAVQAALAEDRIVLPLAGLPWQYAVREGVVSPAVHPAYGPHWTGSRTSRREGRTR